MVGRHRHREKSSTLASNPSTWYTTEVVSTSLVWGFFWTLHPRGYEKKRKDSEMVKMLEIKFYCDSSPSQSSPRWQSPQMPCWPAGKTCWLDTGGRIRRWESSRLAAGPGWNLNRQKAVQMDWGSFSQNSEVKTQINLKNAIIPFFGPLLAPPPPEFSTLPRIFFRSSPALSC